MGWCIQMTEFKIENVFKSPDNAEMYITITLSNSDIKNIKSAITMYQGDKDDTKNQQKMEKLRDNIHQAWKALNPS